MQKDLLSDFLHLYHSLGHRRAVLAALLDHFDGDSEQVCRSCTSELRAAGLDHHNIRKIRARQHPQVARDQAWAATSRNHLVHYQHSAYPELLRQTKGYPVLLYASGNLPLLSEPQVAIVGSRNCTPGGAQTAFDFAAQLAAGGLVITSGMALGIDAAAHRGALHAEGKTIAVTGTGLDLIYPSANRELSAEIIDRGLIVSEFPLGTRARPANFPQRNRIISGLAMATVVVEAAKRSGSLITARLAAEQGREVYAIPGSIHNPQTRGCHQLIQDGAMLVETPADIIGGLSGLVGFVLEQKFQHSESRIEPLDSEHQRLLEVIGYDPVDCDILVQRSGLTIDKLSSMLLVLELSDLIQSAPGGCFVRI